MRYRRGDVEVEAVLFTPELMQRASVATWPQFLAWGWHEDIWEDDARPGAFAIYEGDTPTPIEWGHWLVKEGHRFFTVAPDVFAAEYARVAV